jgi:hypothetical protein
VDDPDAVSTIEERRDLVANGREAARLHLDEQVPADEVDHEPVDGDLGEIPWSGVSALQGGVQRSLTKHSDPRRGYRRHRGISITDRFGHAIAGSA